MPETFGRERRLTQRADFLRAYQQGGAHRAPGFVCHVLDTGDRTRPSRLGITAARRVGPAHRRNRYKRWTREVFRRRTLRPGFDIVVTFRSEAAALSFARFEAALTGVLERARVMAS